MLLLLISLCLLSLLLLLTIIVLPLLYSLIVFALAIHNLSEKSFFVDIVYENMGEYFSFISTYKHIVHDNVEINFAYNSIEDNTLLYCFLFIHVRYLLRIAFIN